MGQYRIGRSLSTYLANSEPNRHLWELNSRRRIMKVTGAVLSLFAGIGIGILIVVYFVSAKPIGAGEWLSFAGALLGVGLAVLGAIFVEQWKVHADRKRGLRRLTQALDSLEQASKDRGSHLAGDGAGIMALMSRSMDLEEAANAFDYARQGLPIEDLNLWRNLQNISILCNDMRITIAKHNQRLKEHGPSLEGISIAAMHERLTMHGMGILSGVRCVRGIVSS